MNGYQSIIIGLYLLGAFLVNKASADFMDFLHYDTAKQVVQSKPLNRSSNTKLSLAAQDNEKLRIVKVGSNVFRNQLLEAGCVEAHQVKFLKCSQDVLDRELDRYDPIR